MTSLVSVVCAQIRIPATSATIAAGVVRVSVILSAAKDL